MPLLAGWITSIFSSFAAVFALWFTKKAAFIVAGLATFSGMVVALYAAFAAMVGAISVAFPSGGAIATGIWLFVPDIAPACLAVMIAADTALSLFFWQFVNLKIAMKGI